MEKTCPRSRSRIVSRTDLQHGGACPVGGKRSFPDNQLEDFDFACLLPSSLLRSNRPIWRRTGLARLCVAEATDTIWASIGVCIGRVDVGWIHVTCIDHGPNVDEQLHFDLCHFTNFYLHRDYFCDESFGSEHHSSGRHAHSRKRNNRLLVAWIDCACRTETALGMDLVCLHSYSSSFSYLRDPRQACFALVVAKRVAFVISLRTD